MSEIDGGQLAGTDLSDADYRRLADLRRGLREFLHWSAAQAQAAGLTPVQHQLLLAVRASDLPQGPTVGDMADALAIRHHSAVKLVDRAQEAGLVRRERDAEHHAAVRLHLTEQGTDKLRSLSRVHQRELAQLAPTMAALWRAINDADANSKLRQHG